MPPATTPTGAGSAFERAVLAVVRSLPAGGVSTYGEVALEAGHPGRARAVGAVLARGADVPWWRVVNASGRLVPGHEAEHARRLRAEGVPVDEATGHVQLAPLRSSTSRARRGPGQTPPR